MKNSSYTVIVGSQNPVKINAVRQAFRQIFAPADVEVSGADAPSLVSEQPMSAAETRLGAVNRVKHCQQHFAADYYVAIEGGVDLNDDGPHTFAYVVIADQQQHAVGRSATLPLPMQVYRALQQGAELGPLMDSMFNTTNIKQKGGAIGLLTAGVATRESNYTQAVVLALAPFLHPELFNQFDQQNIAD